MAQPQDSSEVKRDASCPIPWTSQRGESPMSELETLLVVVMKEGKHHVKTLRAGK